MDATDRTRARESVDSPEVRDRCSRVGDLYLARVAGKEVMEERAQLWDPRMEDTWSAADAPPLEGADAVIAFWVADRRDQSGAGIVARRKTGARGSSSRG